MKVYVEATGCDSSVVYKDLGIQVVRTLEDADLIQLNGGADIHPMWYGQGEHPRTSCSVDRDKTTKFLTDHALRYDKPLVGICRGGQFINARLGGSMYQDVDGHCGRAHFIMDLMTKENVQVNSVHHQMMIPGPDATVVATSTPITTRREIVNTKGDIINIPYSEEAPEVEVIHYPRYKALCFQAHPEFVKRDHPCRLYFYKLLKRYYPNLFKEYL